MPLPSSGQMTMNAVKAEFSSSQSANLSLTGFGAALGTPVTSNIALAASFYGQSSGVSVTAFTARWSGENEPFEDAAGACEAMNEGYGNNVTLYHDGSNSAPSYGDYIYTNSPGTTFATTGYYGVSIGKGAAYLGVKVTPANNPGQFDAGGGC